jgi:hypothetical protein
MKTQKTILGLLFLLVVSFFSSCTKYDRPAELSIDAQKLEFNTTVLNRKFNLVNKGDGLLVVEVVSDKDWATVVGSGVSLQHAQSAIISVQIHPEFFQDYGVYTANLQVNSNGGNFVVPIIVYYSSADGPQLATDSDYLKFASQATQDYFTLYNDGAQTLTYSISTEASWMQFSKVSGSILPNSEERIDVLVDRTGLDAGSYAADINIDSDGGSAVVATDLDVAVYSVTFFNPVYTPISINVPGFDTVQIQAGGRYSYLFDTKPDSFSYAATTNGRTTTGDTLGVVIRWNETIDLTNLDSPTFNLNVNSDYFFMAVKNTGNYYLELWSVNYGNDYQIDENFYIPNDGYEYGVAYYDAFEDTDIYARLSGTSDDVKWSQGVEFVFPWTDNQYILLENNFKKSQTKRENLKNSVKAKAALTTFMRPTSKPKGSIDLYNKR